MNAIDIIDNVDSTLSTSRYYNIPVIEMKKWQLKRKKDTDIPGHYKAMIFHQCTGCEYERYMNGLFGTIQCTFCKERIPDEIQAVWNLLHWDAITD